MMYEGEEVNSIDLLSDKITSEGNGVKIIIPVKYSDRHDFENKIKEQLAYFENVYFDVPDMDNTFKIYRSEHYQISDLCPDSNMHVCLDNVYYPLDFDKLGMSRIDLNIGLRFSLTDGLFPTPNRESLRYSQEAKQMIKDKIVIIANELMCKYNESIIDTDDVRTAIEFFFKSNRYIKNHKDEQWEITAILSRATVKENTPTLTGYKHFTASSFYKLREYLLNEYEFKFELARYNQRMTQCTNSWSSKVQFQNLDRTEVVIFTGILGERKRRYIKELYKKRSIKLLKKTAPFTLFSKDDNWSKSSLVSGSPDYSCYFDLLKLNNVPKHLWREVILEFQTCINKITSNFIDLDLINIPDAWIAADKAKNYKPTIKAAKNGRIKEKGDVNGKKAVSPERETGFNAKFIPIVYTGKQLSSLKRLHVYAKEEERLALDHLFGMFKVLQNDISFVIMSDREIKTLERYNLHNFMPLSTFLKGHNKPFKRMMTSNLITMFIQLYRNVFKASGALHAVNRGLEEDLNDVFNYEKAISNSYFKSTNENLKLNEYAAAHNLYDLEMLTKLTRIDKLLSKHKFIKKLCDKMIGFYGTVYASGGLTDVMKDMCRYKKMRMNLDNYNLIKEEHVALLEEAA